MQFVSRLVDTKRIAEGDRVGYGKGWCAPRDTMIGIVAAGYGDGYTRFLPSETPLLINGRRVPLAGIISMDLCAVDLGPDARDRVGDPVLLWGEELPVEEIGTGGRDDSVSARHRRFTSRSGGRRGVTGYQVAKNPISTPASCSTSLSCSLRACGPMDWPFTSG
ncbi:MAG: alanine racemase C-terminal domain-containing protein [Woeseiaceae bacterium]|nr:alanine racemase C-terminal domain-containing protein [Woeseiaceae bacterium]